MTMAKFWRDDENAGLCFVADSLGFYWSDNVDAAGIGKWYGPFCKVDDAKADYINTTTATDKQQ
jgi:hypothetical protein